MYLVGDTYNLGTQHSYGLTKSDVRSFRALPHSASIRDQLQGVEISESFLDKTRLKSW